MKKRANRGLAVLAAVTMMMSMLPLSAMAASSETSGSCGKDVQWSLSGDTLTISGTGEMQDYEWASPPWKYQEFTKLVIEEGVTYLGTAAFSDSKLQSITWADSVEKLVILPLSVVTS